MKNASNVITYWLRRICCLVCSHNYADCHRTAHNAAPQFASFHPNLFELDHRDSPSVKGHGLSQILETILKLLQKQAEVNIKTKIKIG